MTKAGNVRTVHKLCKDMSPKKFGDFINKLKLKIAENKLTEQDYKQWLEVKEDYTEECNIASRLLILAKNNNNNSGKLKNASKLHPKYIEDLQDRLIQDLVDFGYNINTLEGGRRNKTYKHKVKKNKSRKYKK